MYIVIQNGLQYNTHDSGYSNKQENKIKEKRGGGEKKEDTMNENRTKLIIF